MTLALLLLAQVVDLAVREGAVAEARADGVTLDGKPVRTSVVQVAGVTFARDGALLVFGGRPGRSGQLERVGGWSVNDHEDTINAAACGDGWIATASHDRTIAVRDPSNGRRLRALEGHTGGVLALAVSPDGRVLASGGEDATIRVWNAATGALVRTIANHHDRVGALAWSPDGRYLASGSRDRTVRLWQPEIGRLVRIVRGHEGEVLDLAWGPGALVSGCADGQVRLIDESSAAIVKPFEAGGYVSAVAVTATEILGGEKRWAR